MIEETGVQSRDQGAAFAAYQELHEHLATLKHLIYDSTPLSDPESIALLISTHIRELNPEADNAIYLLEDEHNLVEIVRSGKRVAPENRQVLDLEACEFCRRVMRDQMVIFEDGSDRVADLFPGVKAPSFFPIRSLAFPIQGKQKAIGFFWVEGIKASSRDFYQLLREFIGILLNNSMLHGQVEEKRKELEELSTILFTQNAHLSSLHHLSLDITGTTDKVILCQIVTDAIVRELGANRAAVFLLDPFTQELQGVAGSGGLPEVDTLRLPLEQKHFLRQSLESGRVISYKNYSEGLQLGSQEWGKWAVFPLKASECTLGVVVVDIMDQDIHDSVAIMVNQAAMVIQNLMILDESKKTNELLQEANAQLANLSIIDFLTGLYNHRYFQDRLEAEFNRAHRHQHALSLLLLDLDRFKEINDQYGHAVGDKVLKEACRRLRYHLRVSDIAARYGGDEFAIILPETDLEGARNVAEKMQSGICREPVAAGDLIIPLSLSIGGAAFPADGIVSREELFHAADQAMYRVKQRGRGSIDMAG